MSFKSIIRAASRGILFAFLASLAACGGGSTDDGINIEKGVFGPNVWGTPDTFRGAGIVNNDSFLFSGPLTQGRQGDILLQNDQIRIIVQKPIRNTGVGIFGGNIIDADRFRPSSEPGQDQFGTIFPLINLSWTANYQRLEIINADFANGPVVVRATGILDVYDYIQTTIIVPFAKIFKGVDLVFLDQFSDLFNPFKNVVQTVTAADGTVQYVHLSSFNPVIVTDYTLKPDSSYVIMETRLQNDGAGPLKTVVGDWVNGSGTLELFAPTQGFVRGTLIDNANSLIYEGMQDDVGVSYGYFYNPIQFVKEDGTIPGSAALSVSGVTPMVLGEEKLLNVIPLSGTDPKINFRLPPGVRTITRYFVVGTGDVASVLDEGFKALGISKIRLSGQVMDTGNQPVDHARVVVFDAAGETEKPVTVSLSDGDGNFAMDVSTGRDIKDQIFGSGSYVVRVYKEGYVYSGGPLAGKCTGGNLDTAASTVTGVKCTLGSTGTVSVTATENSQPVAARITVVGFEASPIHPDGAPPDFGKWGDVNLEERPYGIVDLMYIDPTGVIAPTGHHRVLGGNQFRLEPGEYEIYVTRGPEYSVFKQRITVPSGGSVNVAADLTKVLDTSGYISADFHLHSIKSADSVWGLDSRVRAALAEGMDIIVSSDHDFVTDYQPVIDRLGWTSLIASMSGDEITPLAFGHLGVYPIEADPSSPTGGAYDYTYVPSDEEINPDHDMVQTFEQIFSGVDQAYPGTQVLQMNHILDKATGSFAIAGLVTSPSFNEVEPLSTYADPVNFRMPANSNQGGGFQGPFPVGTSGMFSTNFTAVELTIGAYVDTLDHLMQSALPTWFNMLNLGLIKTATTDSDSHTQVREPMGTPRNYVISSIDPRDGIGSSFPSINREEIAVNVNAHRSIASNGIFVRASLTSASNPGGVTVGGTVEGGDVTLNLEVSSNEYFDWDSVEIYANTEPIPAKDDLSGPTDMLAKDFHQISSAHTIKYIMAPLFTYTRGGSGDSALNQTVAAGVRKAVLSHNFHFDQDTWVVVVARGTNGVRSLFPYVTKGARTTVPSAQFLDKLDSDPTVIGGIRPFAFTNPMFVDVDGNGFEAKYIRDGSSPLAK